MLSFQEYRKSANITHISRVRAREMYNMYIKGEEEIMGSGCAQSITPTDFARAKEALNKANVPMKSISFSAPFKCAPFWDVAINTECKQEQEGTTPMNTERDYLNRRLDETVRKLDQNLSKQFHLGESTAPKTYKEMIDWIKNDKFEIDKKQAKMIDLYIEEDNVYYGSFLDGIVWTGAGFKNDREGYDAAYKVMRKAFQEAKDIVNTSDAAAGLKALQEFEAWTYEVPKSKRH